MKLLLLFFLLGNVLFAQEIGMRGLANAKYQVGFQDTVIFDPDDWYKYGQDSIKKPLWIQIWYPTDVKSGSQMLFSEYVTVQSNSLPTPWKSIFQAGVEQAIWTDLLKVNRNTRGELVPNDTSIWAWKTLLNSSVNVKKNAPIVRAPLPVILYHHGAQSVPFDNHIACEHWASKGYIVASAWYNWPSNWAPDYPLISRPIDSQYFDKGVWVSDQKITHLKDLFLVAQFLKTFPSAKSSGWVGIGHSWGAQTWLEYDFSGNPKVAETIVSLHTTAESDTREDLERDHPNLRPLITGEAKKATTPSFIIAPKNPWWYGKKTNVTDTLDDPGFFPFRKNPYTPYCFIAGPYIDHNAFISWAPWMAHLSRQNSNFLSKEDSAYYEKNWNNYREVIQLCDRILEARAKNSWITLPKSLKKTWKIEKYNLNSW
jgi:hypothetical protein